jgi:hypothetical protein
MLLIGVQCFLKQVTGPLLPHDIYHDLLLFVVGADLKANYDGERVRLERAFFDCPADFSETNRGGHGAVVTYYWLDRLVR